VTDFIDFSPLFRLRDELKKRFAKGGIETVPLSAVFLWLLAYQPEFKGVKFANAVDVPANETKEAGRRSRSNTPGRLLGSTRVYGLFA
jgi:hypothetical protein